MKKLIIFDADSIIWTVAYKFRNKKLKQMVLVALNKFIDDVISNAEGTHYIGFYGSKEEDRIPNFRYAIDANYKGTRPAPPDWLEKWRPVIHKEMTDKWGFVPVDGMEADDACSIAVEENREDYDEIVVATSDKDLLQIPDIIYYNYTKHTYEETDEISSAMALGTQMLTGDSADNIKGLYKVGPVKAKNMLSGCASIIEINWTVARAYVENEEELYKKAVKTVTAEVIKDMEDNDWNKGKSEKQIERKIRITSQSLIQNEMDRYIPGGWKDYFKTQYSLLKMLVKSPNGWTVPDAVEYDNVPVDKGMRANDDFLYTI